jgi:hypothetical protein
MDNLVRELYDALDSILEDKPLPNGTYVHLLVCNASRNQPPGEADMCICLKSKKKLLHQVQEWKDYGQSLYDFCMYCKSIGISLPWESFGKFKAMNESLKKVQEQCFPKITIEDATKNTYPIETGFKLVARLKAQDGYGRRDMVQRFVAEGYAVKEDIVKKDFTSVPDYFLMVYEKI